MRRQRVAFYALVWTPVALVAGLSAFAAVAAQFGRVSLKWDIVAHFAPMWLVGAAAALVAAFLFRGWPRVLVVALSVIGIGSALTLIVPEYLRPVGPQAPLGAQGALKIVQFNIWHSNPDPEAIARWLDQERPDIAVLEESSGKFAAVMARHPGWHIACRYCEVTILSRQPAIAVETPKRGRLYVPLIRAVFRDAHGPFEVIGVHNAWPTDVNDQQRQERRLAAFIAKTPRTRTIVTGDFNSAPWSFSRRRWDEAFSLIRRERALPTWPAHSYKRLRWFGLPYLPIDHVYAGPAWGTVSIARGPRLSSDHYPVVVTLAPLAPR